MNESIMKTDRRGRLRYTPEQKNTMVEAYLASGLSITDLRTGAAGMVTNTSFSESGQVLSSTQGGRTTSFEFDKLGRVVKVDAPNTYDPAGSPGNTDRQNITRTSYWPTGQVKAVWGDGTYPTVRVYDDQNRLKELRTFRGWTHTTGATGPDESTVGADITLWFHDPVTGRLLLKTYPDGEDADTARDSGPEYHYTPGGRLKSRTWARGSHTRYDYAHGQLTHVRYFTSAAADTGTNPGNDPATPDVVRSYDALGRPQSVSSSVSQSQFAYDDTSTTNPPHVATRTLDTETLTIDPDGTGGLAQLTRVIDRTTDALLRPGGYSLLAGGTTEATAGYHYSTTHGGLLGISAAGVPNLSGKSYAWEYTRMAGNASLIDTVSGPVHLVDNTWDTTRDVMLSKANTTVVNGGTVDVSTIAYTVNAIGQREAASRSGSATNSTVWHYDPLGPVIAADDSTNTSDRAYAYDSIGNRTKTASGTLALPTSPTYTSNALNQYTAIPEAPAQQLYDADGNMTRGRVPQISVVINLVWDGENRLVEVNVPGVSIVKYAYDAMGRRVVKTTPTATTLYLYDGWNVIAEYTVSNSQYQLFKSYLWGLDLSGTMQGAGGVGGLLAVKQGSALHYPAYDGNGNVTEYLDANKAVAARFEYDPFGNTVVNTDTTGQFPYRFSTKPVDAETGLHYYGYRWYNSLTGRWPSRDPIEEDGGLNLYGFNYNNSFNWYDYLGREPRWSDCSLDSLPPYDPLIARDRIPLDEILRKKKILDRPDWMDDMHVITVKPLPDKYGCVPPYYKDPAKMNACGETFNTKSKAYGDKLLIDMQILLAANTGTIHTRGWNPISIYQADFFSMLAYISLMSKYDIDMKLLQTEYENCVKNVPCICK